MLRKEVDTIILDVDGTLSEEVSWLKITESLGASPNEHASLFDQFKKGRISYSEAKAKLIKLWQATGNANKDFMEKTCRTWSLRKDANEIVDYLKRTYKVCLISGAIDLYVKIVAEKLGVPDWFANTELIWDEQGNLTDFNYYPDQAQKKLEQFRKFISQKGLNEKKCAIVGDGDSDIVLFRELKYGVEVNETPHPELKGLTYKTVKTLSELKNIF
jgi:HAD superfamily phosphoserine phosphatase-like hydrolase